MPKQHICICLWSGPRNVSTALMYSFRQRRDTKVVDEPLYGHYLRVSGAQHPGRADVLTHMDVDGARVMNHLVRTYPGRAVLFLKHMAHHLVQLDLGFLDETRNVLLIRDPEQMLRSLIKQLPDPKLADTGLARQRELFEYLCERGRSPPVVDARELLLHPPAILRQLCARLEIPFDRAMLSWPRGPKAEDGVWAPHWYANVHESTGFQPYRAKTGAFPERLLRLLEECRPHYEYLHARSIRAKA